MNEFTIEKNEFLHRPVKGYFHTRYFGIGNPGNPDFICTLKNNFRDKSESDLRGCVDILHKTIFGDFHKIMGKVLAFPLTICVVPRAKIDDRYRPDQLLFRATVRDVASSIDGLDDGSDFIIRHTNTMTTHLKKMKPNDSFVNDGKCPYPGISLGTCQFSSSIDGRDILLVDDVYTKNVNIDEDMLQALFDKGARSVVFYAVGGARIN